MNPRRRQLAALARLRKRAAFAPKGSKATALERLKRYMTDLLKREVRKHG